MKRIAAVAALALTLAGCSSAEPDEAGFLSLMDAAGYPVELMDAETQLETGYGVCEGAAEAGESTTEYAERVGSLMEQQGARDWYAAIGIAAGATLCP